MARDEHIARVHVRVEGASSPVSSSAWLTTKQAERLKREHEAIIKRNGWTHVVSIEQRQSFAEWQSIALGRPVTDDDQWGATHRILRVAYDIGESAEAWAKRLAGKVP